MRRWEPRPPQGLLRAVAAATEGFAGADLAALCAGAVMAAVRRTAPGLIGDLDSQIRQALPVSAPAAQEEAAGSAQAQSGATGRDGSSGAAVTEAVRQSRTGETCPQADAAGAEEPGQPGHPSSADGRLPIYEASVGFAGDEQPAGAASELCSQSPGRDLLADAATHDRAAENGAFGQEGGSELQQAGPRSDPPGQLGSGGQGRSRLPAELQGLTVRAADWREALEQAPEPCARRQGLAALSAEAPRPMPGWLLRPLLPNLARLLAALHASGLPLPGCGTCCHPHASVFPYRTRFRLLPLTRERLAALWACTCMWTGFD